MPNFQLGFLKAIFREICISSHIVHFEIMRESCAKLNMLKYVVLILWRKKGVAANFYAFYISANVLFQHKCTHHIYKGENFWRHTLKDKLDAKFECVHIGKLHFCRVCLGLIYHADLYRRSVL